MRSLQKDGLQSSAKTPPNPTPLYGAQLAQTVGLWTLIKEDYARHRKQLFAPGFHAILAYRICTWRQQFRNRLARYILGFPGRVGLVVARNVYGIELYETTRIARRLMIAHQHGIVLHQYATIGNDCVVRHGVTIGVSNSWEPGVGPTIGDNVHFGVGAVIIGNVAIGDNVSIGPNCVVSTNVPNDTIVFAPQSRILPRKTES